MKITIAPDSFKGSLSARELGEAMKEGVLNAAPEAFVKVLPMGDGGEGTLEVIEGLIEKKVKVKVRGPLPDQRVETSFAILSYQGKETAFIECARSTGLTLVPKNKRDPYLLNSYGLGEQIRAALKSGFNDLIISLGGSATTDGGTGMLQALGYRFFDQEDNLLTSEENILNQITQMDTANVLKELEDCRITVLCDVKNPFYGENGAAYIYGPQKGADMNQIADLDSGLKGLASLVMNTKKIDLQSLKGAGAAGGLGGALAGIMNAELKSGFTVIAELLRLEDEIRTSDFVLTGEGNLDAQSMQGKVPVSVAEYASKYHVPAIALAGGIELRDHYHPLEAVFSIQSSPCSMEEAIENTYENTKFTTAQIISLLQINES